MRKIIFKIKDFYTFAKVHGFWFAFKYKTGLAKEGKDFS